MSHPSAPRNLTLPPTGVLHGRIDGNGIEQHAETLAQLYDLEFTQLDAADMQMELNFIATPSCVLYRETYQSNTHALGSLLPGKFAFAVPIRERGTRWWGGERTADLMPTAVGGEIIDISFSPGHSHFVAVLEQSWLVQKLHQARISDHVIRMVMLRSGRHSQLLKFHQSSLDRVSGGFERIFDELGAAGARMAGSRFEDQIMSLTLSLLDNAPVGRKPTSAATRLFKRALDTYEDLGDFPSIATLCTKLGASPRTLEYSFQRNVGIGPYRFFMLRRLNRARQELSRHYREECNVTRIALSHGFTELGRFAVRYRELFGETPSTTLARKPRVVCSIPFLIDSSNG